VPLIAHPERTQYFYEMLSRCMKRDSETLEARDTGRGRRDVDILKPLDTEILETRGAGNLQESRAFLKRFWPFGSQSSRSAYHVSRASFPDLPENCLFHGNLGSFTGFYGEKIQRQAYELLKLGVYSALASDLHDGSSAPKVLVQEKFETNPFLKRLAEFDGSTTVRLKNQGSYGERGQGELF
jgi:hypothetical protein